jgi:DNA-directed RNA polymerase specialized sigma24 family protein
MTELELLRTNHHYYASLYWQHRVVVFQHLKQFTKDEAYLADLYQDAIIVLFEKARDPEFALTCSIQTYLIAICRNQIFKRAGRAPEILSIEGERTNYYDWLTDQLEIERQKSQLDKLDRVLFDFEEIAKKCYELLYRFFYLKESFDLIAKVMGHTNADNAKNKIALLA